MTYQFAMRPSTPDADTRAALAQQAREALAATMPPTAEADPAYGVDASDAGDTEIRPGAVVRILASNPNFPLDVRVLKVCANGMLKVRDLTVPAVQWRVSVDEVALVLVDGVA
jgi:hypothetical protein